MNDFFDFKEAFETVKEGYKVTRKHWEGTGMYIWYLPPAEIKAEWCKDNHLKKLCEDNGGTILCEGAIRLKTQIGTILTGYKPSEDDLVAVDWKLVDYIKIF